MNISERTFSDEADFPAMMALAQAFAPENLHVVDLPYRLSSWAMDDPDNVGLWVNGDGDMVAWAVMQTPFWTIDYAYVPKTDPMLHRHILTWADRRARRLVGTSSGHPCWFVMVFADQQDRIRDLEDVGFESQADVGENSWSKVLLERTAGVRVAMPTLPAGFAIRPLAGEGEIDDYVLLHRDVFESKNMTIHWRARTLKHPEYSSDLDLVAVAPDGQLGAFCVCWFDRDSSTGQVEPLGVRADFRNSGLGRAILAEGLRRLFHRGAERVLVETDTDRDAAMRLYESLGFRPHRDVLVYRKDYEHP
jgi:ribosomal protein S18 acetylase RimI-like enzyme